MEKYKIQRHPPFRTFGIVEVSGKTYVCPGWHEVPNGTTREQIELVENGETYVPPVIEAPVEKVEESKGQEWQVEGSKGNIYTVTYKNYIWDCTCPARQFRRGDCKHIKAKKDESQSVHVVA